MLITVNLMSKKEGEIKRFLSKYFEKESAIDENVIEWIYVYRNVVKALDVIDSVMDNYSDYNISLWVQVGDEDIVEVTKYNRTKLTAKILKSTENAGIF